MNDILDEDYGYCAELDPSLDPAVIAERKVLLDKAFGTDELAQIAALKTLQEKYGATCLYRKGYGTLKKLEGESSWGLYKNKECVEGTLRRIG